MTKTMLIAHIAKVCGVSKKLAGDMVAAMLDWIKTGLVKYGEVRIQGHGSYKLSKRAAREGVNPRKPSEKIKIPAMTVPTFRAGTDLKSAVRDL